MNAPSTAELMLRMVLSLAIMGGLLWLALRLGTGRRGRSVLGAVGGGKRPDHIEVCARRQLSRSASLTLVRVGERTLLLGVGEAGVQVLADGDDLTTTELADASVDVGAMAIDVGATAVDVGDVVVHTVPGRAGTHAPRASGTGPARMGVVDALRELTVRR